MNKRTREDAVYITKVPPDVTMEQMAELFGSIGVIKVCTVQGSGSGVGNVTVYLGLSVRKGIIPFKN